jgi:hypothetical protein
VDNGNLDLAMEDFVAEYRQWMDSLALVKVNLEKKDLEGLSTKRIISKERMDMLIDRMQYVKEKERELAVVYKKIFSCLSSDSRPEIIDTPRTPSWLTRRLQSWAYAKVKDEKLNKKISSYISFVAAGTAIAALYELARTSRWIPELGSATATGDILSQLILSSAAVVGFYSIFNFALSDIPVKIRDYRNLYIDIRERRIRSLK